jgi:hypothetical protein
MMAITNLADRGQDSRAESIITAGGIRLIVTFWASIPGASKKF